MLRFRRKHDIGHNLCEETECAIPVEEDNSPIDPIEDGEIDCAGKQTCSVAEENWADE